MGTSGEKSTSTGIVMRTKGCEISCKLSTPIHIYIHTVRRSVSHIDEHQDGMQVGGFSGQDQWVMWLSSPLWVHSLPTNYSLVLSDPMELPRQPHWTIWKVYLVIRTAWAYTFGTSIKYLGVLHSLTCLTACWLHGSNWLCTKVPWCPEVHGKFPGNSTS